MSNEAKVVSIKTGEPAPGVVDELKKKWGEIRQLKSGSDVLIVRQPNEAEWDRFMSKCDANPAKQNDAMKELLGLCIAWASEPLEAMLKRRPAYGKKFGMALIEWAAGGEGLEKNDL